MITKIYPDNPDYRLVDKLVNKLRDGAIIIFPTGIGYALGCNALKQQAVEEIYRLKRSDMRKQRFAIMCPSLAEAAKYAKIDQTAFRFIKQYAEEPITYILPVLSTLPKLLKANREIGIRLSHHPVTTLLLENLDIPLITASLPVRHGELEYLTHPDLIDEEYGNDVFTVVDGGEAVLEQTAIIRLIDKEIEILREAETPILSEK